ncbi:MAG: hypothetical protein R3240_07955, partial [Gammaproteobacteria bacterium]|nr:hypothetical protein [Gammaproteobacteria bacterium]
LSREQLADLCEDDPVMMTNYNPDITRVGRNFFRVPPDPNTIQALGLPTITKFWHLRDRPLSENQSGFIGKLKQNNLDAEKAIPYSKSGGFFIADIGNSVVPEMKDKEVYQLNYRWQNLNPAFPMTLLVDEVVQIAEGVYLGQLVYATKHFNLGAIDVPFIKGEQDIILGESYQPRKKPSFWQHLINLILGRKETATIDYGYQNNGYFLMVDPAYAKQVYADDAFPQLRPRPGEIGWQELGYEESSRKVSAAVGQTDMDWVAGWQEHEALKEKFTRFISEKSPVASDNIDPASMRGDNESILQMLKRISDTISEQTKMDDHMRHFEVLHQLFRQGVAPRVVNGVFRGAGENSFNTDYEGNQQRTWYGQKEPISGFNYYHGATMNLHWGFTERFDEEIDDSYLFPSALASLIQDRPSNAPNAMNMLWRSIGKYIFPWAGKSYERVSGRKLSMLLDESDDLEQRYPERVKQIRNYLASAFYSDAIKKNAQHYWPKPGLYAEHLQNGSWDQGMTAEDKAFWETLANNTWVFGHNLQDKRIQAMDAIMRIADLNYISPDAGVQALANTGPSPFIRQGYCFLGAADQASILDSNNSEQEKKRVFQFNYRYPMMGGPIPINYCLDEIVEIADGLFLGQLIYSTALDLSYHSSVDPVEYKYKLFGFFLLLDDDWERHRQAIGFDIWRDKQVESGLAELLS